MYAGSKSGNCVVIECKAIRRISIEMISVCGAVDIISDLLFSFRNFRFQNDGVNIFRGIATKILINIVQQRCHFHRPDFSVENFTRFFCCTDFDFILSVILMWLFLHPTKPLWQSNTNKNTHISIGIMDCLVLLGSMGF